MALRNNWGMAFGTLIYFNLSAQFNVFFPDLVGNFDLHRRTLNKQNPKQANPRFFRIAMKNNHSHFWFSTLSGHKWIPGRVIFPRRFHIYLRKTLF